MTQDEMAECYDKYSGRIYRTAFAHCRSRADAEAHFFDKIRPTKIEKAVAERRKVCYNKR